MAPWGTNSCWPCSLSMLPTHAHPPCSSGNRVQWPENGPGRESWVSAVRLHQRTQGQGLLIGYVRALTASATQQISIKESLFVASFIWCQPVMFFLEFKINTTCSLLLLETWVCYLLKIMEKSRKRRRRRRNWSNFHSHSVHTLMKLWRSSTHPIHYHHDSQIAIMFNGFSHCQSGMETDQSLEDEGSIFAYF